MYRMSWKHIREESMCFGGGWSQGKFTEEGEFELDLERWVGVGKAEEGEGN